MAIAGFTSSSDIFRAGATIPTVSPTFNGGGEIIRIYIDKNC
jgi:hypothetical protein